MSALGRFGRFTLFSPRVSHSKHLPFSFCLWLCVGFGVFVAFLCFCFLFCKCFGIPNSPRSLDLDDRQGLIASSAMQQKKKVLCVWQTSTTTCPFTPVKDRRVCRAEYHHQPSIEFRVRLSDKQDTLSLSISIDSMLRVDHIRAIHIITPSVQRMLLRETLSRSQWKPGLKTLLPEVCCLEKGDWQDVACSR